MLSDNPMLSSVIVIFCDMKFTEQINNILRGGVFMPRVGITAYDLLISCPGDVNQFIDIIRECVDNFNRVYGNINNMEIVTKHWSTDSYPQSGDKPQELLNKQFVRECDAAVAIFWTKFGTPTDKYGSGTEEEIEEMLSSNKQVFTSTDDSHFQKCERLIYLAREKA